MKARAKCKKDKLANLQYTYDTYKINNTLFLMKMFFKIGGENFSYDYENYLKLKWLIVNNRISFTSSLKEIYVFYMYVSINNHRNSKGVYFNYDNIGDKGLIDLPIKRVEDFKSFLDKIKIEHIERIDSKNNFLV